MLDWWMPVLFFAIAALYAVVGHGGASGYLALMALLGFAPEELRPTALVLNVIVSLASFIFFRRAGFFRWRLFWPFALASVPSAWLGAQVQLPSTMYRMVLGAVLLFAVWRIMRPTANEQQAIGVNAIAPSLLIGALLGGLAGMIGIGGGILLSPVILLLRWGDVKTTAAVSALFILVNSLAGLFGLCNGGITLHPSWMVLAVAVLVGGILGGWSGSGPLSTKQVRVLLALVLSLASVKLLFLS